MLQKRSVSHLSIICYFCIWCVTLMAPTVLHAHGALLTWTETTGISIQASYHNGHSMAGAQIAVFAPDNPMTPWLTGTADDQGHFSFVPPPEQTGTVTVQAQLAGHGTKIHIPLTPAADVANSDQPAPEPTDYSTTQRLLMAASVVWGCIGTAFYFKRRKD